MRTAAALAVVTLALGAMLWAADDVVVAPQQGATATPVSEKTASGTDAITIPQIMTYQGRLTDASGMPVPNGDYSVAFKLYTAPEHGSPFWNETQNVTIRGGLFSVLLGSVTPINAVSAASAAYLGMAVAGDAEMTPRLRIAGTASTAALAAGSGPRGGTDVDDAWVRIGSDSVLYTTRRLGLAKGGAGNVLYGTYGYTQTNFGSSCTVGVSSSNVANISVGGGYGNCGAAPFATVPGGRGNRAGGTAADTAAVVAGGNFNAATGKYTTIGGGRFNIASGWDATVGGGSRNRASSNGTTVNGGYGNTAGGTYATTGGGYTNQASASYTTAAGGYGNTATNSYATVGGGYVNRASGRYATTGGGRSDTASGQSSTVGGGYVNRAGGNYATVGGGQANAADSAYSTVSGGALNLNTGAWATVAGGTVHTVSDTGATIGGGGANYATGKYATIGGGAINAATAYGTTVSGGEDNEASADYATVGGGESDTASGYYATVGGGQGNTASGDYATVPGGRGNIAAGNCSFAMGDGSEVPIDYTGSAAFNGGLADDDGEVRCDVLAANSMVFELDYPLDPDGSIMNQFAVGSPEIVLVFRGTAEIGTEGQVVAQLPVYFDALCRNANVQLTGVGNSDVYVAADVEGDSFSIGGQPGTKVYWTVTGERTDQLAEITRLRMPVQERRTGALVGRSISDASLVGSMPELQRLGLAGRYSFRTAEGKQRYEAMLARSKGQQPVHRLPGDKRYQDLLQKLQEPAPQEP